MPAQFPISIALFRFMRSDYEGIVAMLQLD